MGWEYTYCNTRGCNEGLPKATLEQAIEQSDIHCSNGHANPCNVSQTEALLEMFERLKALELKVGLIK